MLSCDNSIVYQKTKIVIKFNNNESIKLKLSSFLMTILVISSQNKTKQKNLFIILI
jgi:hypothetical protein